MLVSEIRSLLYISGVLLVQNPFIYNCGRTNNIFESSFSERFKDADDIVPQKSQKVKVLVVGFSGLLLISLSCYPPLP